jgi:dephospho-CoA kinase
MTRRVGLTGGIGSGKSTVAALFQELAVPVIDSDVIAHQLTALNGTAIPALHAEFGDIALHPDGALNRAYLRQLVFADMLAKQRLEAILHPLIRTQMLREVEQVDVSTPYLLLVVPLLFESKSYRELVQRTLLVDCSEATQIDRTMQRSGLDEVSVRAIMAQQMGRESRRQLADDIIDNENDIVSLRPKIARLHQCYLTQNVGSD